MILGFAYFPIDDEIMMCPTLILMLDSKLKTERDRESREEKRVEREREDRALSHSLMIDSCWV